MISAASEYVLAFCFMGYFVTLVPDFKKLSLAPIKLIDRQANCTDVVVVPVSDLGITPEAENDSAA